MTATDLAVRQPQPMALSNEQLQYIAATEFVPPGLRGNLPAILACVATGRALGIADMTALRSIHIIDGKATYSAELMVQLVRKYGHSITGDVTEGKAVVTGRRADNGDAMTVTWTLEMADRAGLLNKQNWRKYPEAMLWARAASQLCRMLFADCFAGATYTPEEIGAETDADGDPIPEAHDPAGGTPFADDPEEEYVPAPATAAQKKKLNVLVGQLRDAERVTTDDLWGMVGRDPELSEDGYLHWSPLRDSLSKQEAHALIEWLTSVEAAGASASETADESADQSGPERESGSLFGGDSGGVRPTSVASAGSEADGLAARLLDLVDPDKTTEVTELISKNREAHAVAPDRHIAWLNGQIAKLEARRVPA